jgi:hypothetical protein
VFVGIPGQALIGMGWLNQSVRLSIVVVVRVSIVVVVRVSIVVVVRVSILVVLSKSKHRGCK